MQGAFLAMVEVMNVFPLGRGCFRLRFKTSDQAEAVLGRSLVYLGFGAGVFARVDTGHGPLLLAKRFYHSYS